MIQFSVLPVRNLRFVASAGIFPALRPETEGPSLPTAQYTDLHCVSRNVGVDFVHYHVVCVLPRDVIVTWTWEHLSIYWVHYGDYVSVIFYSTSPLCNTLMDP